MDIESTFDLDFGEMLTPLSPDILVSMEHLVNPSPPNFRPSVSFGGCETIVCSDL